MVEPLLASERQESRDRSLSRALTPNWHRF
jgi:hypothetical protein